MLMVTQMPMMCPLVFRTMLRMLGVEWGTLWGEGVGWLVCVVMVLLMMVMMMVMLLALPGSHE